MLKGGHGFRESAEALWAATAPDSERALRELSDYEVDGRAMQVKYDDNPSGGQAPQRETYAPVQQYGATRDKGTRLRPGGAPYSTGKGKDKDKGTGKGGGSGKGNARVFFSNVPFTTNEGYLRKQFEDVGTIVDFDFWRKTDGSSMGMGTCEYDHPQGAKRALQSLHDAMVDGRPLNVKMDDGGNGKGKGGGRY